MAGDEVKVVNYFERVLSFIFLRHFRCMIYTKCYLGDGMRKNVLAILYY